jgi:hypothetical protein
METKYFYLSYKDDSRIVRIARMIFGAACIALGAFWLVYNIKTTTNTGSLWITIFFLLCFGIYQIWAGAGKAERYIAIGEDSVLLKRYIFLPHLKISASQTEKVELFPLKILLHLKSGKKILFRLGTMYYEINEKITDELLHYCEEKNIKTEIIKEEI